MSYLGLVQNALLDGCETVREVAAWLERMGEPPRPARSIRRALYELVCTHRAQAVGRRREGGSYLVVYRPGEAARAEPVVTQVDLDRRLLIERMERRPVIHADDLFAGLGWDNQRKFSAIYQLWHSGQIECDGVSIVGWFVYSPRSPATTVLKTIKPYQEYAA